MTVELPPESIASELIARDFRARLLRFIRARVENAADAEDIVQEVLLRMHRSVKTLSTGERLGAWLFQVARNAIIDHYRTRGRAAEVVDPKLSSDSTADAVAAKPDEDPRRFERDATRCLDAFLERLDARYAEALRLVDIDGLTHKAAAERLGLSVPGVKSRVQRARAMLQKTLGDCCAFDFTHSDGLVEFEAGPTTRSCAGGCGAGSVAGCGPSGRTPA